MKHWKELMDIENVSISLDVLTSTVRVITHGASESNMQDVEHALHNVTAQLELLGHDLRNSFDTLFDAVREDSNNEAKARKAKSKKDKV